MTPGIQLREATFADYEQISALEASQRLRARSREEWSRLWLANPLYQQLKASWPIGWVLEDQDQRIVGTIGNVPVPYFFQGRKLIVAAGRAWAVQEKYRSAALMLMDAYFSQESVDIFLNTTVNALAAEAFGVFGSSPVPTGDWSAASYWVTGYAGFAKTALKVKKLPLPNLLCYPAAVCLYAKDLVTVKRLSSAPSDLHVTRSSSFDDRFDRLWENVAASRRVLIGVRTREVLDWHFGAALQRGETWLLMVPDGAELLAYAVFQRRDEPRTGLQRIRLVDFQAVSRQTECLQAILFEALKIARSTGIHVLEKVGRDVADTLLIDQHAPYRRKLSAWPFYFHAPDTALNHALLSPAAWQPSSFDGDASL